MRDEKRKLFDEIEILTTNCDNLLAKNSEQDKLLREYEFDKT